MVKSYDRKGSHMASATVVLRVLMGESGRKSKSLTSKYRTLRFLQRYSYEYYLADYIKRGAYSWQIT